MLIHDSNVNANVPQIYILKLSMFTNSVRNVSSQQPQHFPDD